MAMGTSRAAGSGTRAKRLIHDLLDGASAPAALCAATQTSIDLSRCARRQLGDGHGAAHVVVAQDVAGTNDHGREGLAGRVGDWIGKTGTGCKRKKCLFKQFQTPTLRWNQARISRQPGRSDPSARGLCNRPALKRLIRQGARWCAAHCRESLSERRLAFIEHSSKV